MDSSPIPCDGRSSPSTGIGTVGCSRPSNHPTPLQRSHSLKRRPQRRRPTFREDAFSTSAYHPLGSKTRRGQPNRSAPSRSVLVCSHDLAPPPPTALRFLRGVVHITAG